MRVIAGTAKRTLLRVPGGCVRPTSDRVREALFSILGGRITEARILDLFSGSGALGIEALSRGAAAAVFVEQDRRACAVIRRNLESTRLVEHATVVCAAVQQWLRRATDCYDLIFADPPYHKSPGTPDAGAALLDDPSLPARLAPGGLLVLESARSLPYETGGAWLTEAVRGYGSTFLHFLRLANREERGEEPEASCS